MVQLQEERPFGLQHPLQVVAALGLLLLQKGVRLLAGDAPLWQQIFMKALDVRPNAGGHQGVLAEERLQLAALQGLLLEGRGAPEVQLLADGVDANLDASASWLGELRQCSNKRGCVLDLASTSPTLRTPLAPAE